MVRDMTGKRQEYFESTLQIRRPTPEIVTFVEEDIHRFKIHISKVVEMKNGFDYYLSDNHFTQSLGKRLQQKFGGELNITSSLYSRKDGKEIYRTTVLFRKANFFKGDTVIYDGEEFTVRAMGKDILLIGITKPRKVHVRFRDMNLIKKKLEW